MGGMLLVCGIVMACPRLCRSSMMYSGFVPVLNMFGFGVNWM